MYTTFRTDGENATRPGGYTGFTYAYDANGNITAINESNGTTSRTRTYTYDALNRLKTDSDPVTGKTTTYTYDARGNILSKNISGQTVTYTYGDSTWKDLLTAYDGTSITYDAIGNPISYLGNTFTWQQGRQLASATTASGKNVTYRYNTDGIRIGKTVNGVNTEYLVDTAGAIHAMKQGNHTLIFMYDSTGRREGFICYSDTYGDAAYYYLYNAQGDVIGLTDGSLNTVVQYTYNAWGKLISTTGSKANTIGKLNPFRYRGYVYDEETGLYYIQARYYDPEVGRWISAEPNVYNGAFDSGAGISAYNTFSYCGNNPVINFDPTGEFILTALIVGVVAGAVIGGAIGGTAAYKSAKSTGAEGSELFTETLKGVATGAVVGGVIGGMAGATAGVATAYGAASLAGTTMITTTATMAAKTMEVTTLQIKKSSNDGDNGWQTANDCINSVFNNGHKIAGKTPFTKSAGFSVNHALNSVIERDFGGKQTIFDTMGSTGGKLAYAGVAYAGCNVFRAFICDDPYERARVRGYTLE